VCVGCVILVLSIVIVGEGDDSDRFWGIGRVLVSFGLVVGLFL